jgi:hypothetical protein
VKILEKLFSKRHSRQYKGENAALVEAMNAVAFAYNPKNRKKMYEALLPSTLLIPTPEIPITSVSNEHQASVSLQHHWITDKQGRKLTPVFTDIEALRNWDPNTPSLSGPARGLFEVISKNFPDIQGVVINPFDPIRKAIRPTGIVTSGEFEVLSRGSVPRHEGAGLFGHDLPSTSLGIQPSNQTLPTAAVEVLCNSASRFREIARLYLFSIAHAHGASQLTVGLGLDGGITRERQQFIVQTLWGAVAPSLIQTEVKNLDFVVLSGKITAQVEQNGSTIYSRP